MKCIWADAYIPSTQTLFTILCTQTHTHAHTHTHTVLMGALFCGSDNYSVTACIYWLHFKLRVYSQPLRGRRMIINVWKFQDQWIQASGICREMFVQGVSRFCLLKGKQHKIDTTTSHFCFCRGKSIRVCSRMHESVCVCVGVLSVLLTRQVHLLYIFTNPKLWHDGISFATACTIRRYLWQWRVAARSHSLLLVLFGVFWIRKITHNSWAIFTS